MAAVEGELTATTASVAATPIADAIPLRLRQRGAAPRRVFAVALIGAAVLAMFASRDLPSWTERLGDSPVAQTVQSLAAEWDGAMARLGLVRPHEALRGAIHRLLDWQWGGLP